MKSRNPPIYLGIDGGGTKTVVVALNKSLAIQKRQEYGPGNFRLLGIEAVEALLRQIAGDFEMPRGVGICLAGLREKAPADLVRKACAAIWPNVPLHIGHDLDAALAAAPEPKTKCAATVIILSGTGSCCYGRNTNGACAKVGGWGHLLGDKGSGYEIALSGLRAVVSQYDREQVWTNLGQRILRRLLLNGPEELISFAQTADKRTIASLTVDLFAAAAEGDPSAQTILKTASDSLASDALRCATRLASPGKKVHFVFAGSVLTKQPEFGQQIADLIERNRPRSLFSTLNQEGAWGAAKLGFAAASGKTPAKNPPIEKHPTAPLYFPKFNAGASPTEQRNPASKNLDTMSLDAAVELMLAEEVKIIPALLQQKGEIVRAVEMISAALRNGGRLIYVGAGTSGRLGVLDASECPPTFRSDPEQIQGIIAGGTSALWQAVEGAEDDANAGAKAIQFRNVTSADVIVGIAASGRTPFVWGAFAQARQHGAGTILVCFNPGLEVSPQHRPEIVIAANLGAEVLTGSTRLKCGTATKLVLNILTTLSMVRLGKVISNLMVDLNPSNIKLRDRALRILSELTGCDAEAASRALAQSGWVMQAALKQLTRSNLKPIAAISPRAPSRK